MAIALDTIVNSTEQTAVSSITLSMTVGSLTNGLLVVASQVRNSANATFTHITGITYNSVALTSAKVQDGPAASRFLTSEIWYLKNPASGAHNIVVTYAASVGIAVIGGISLSGVDQTSPLDATAGAANTTGTPYDVTITTVADNAWITNSLYTASDNAMSVDHSETQAWQVTTNGTPGDRACAAYRGPISPAAATVTGWQNSFPGADEGALAAASWKPFVAAVTTRPPSMSMMGVGA